MRTLLDTTGLTMLDVHEVTLRLFRATQREACKGQQAGRIAIESVNRRLGFGSLPMPVYLHVGDPRVCASHVQMNKRVRDAHQACVAERPFLSPSCRLLVFSPPSCRLPVVSGPQPRDEHGRGWARGADAGRQGGWRHGPGRHRRLGLAALGRVPVGLRRLVQTNRVKNAPLPSFGCLAVCKDFDAPNIPSHTPSL